MTTVYEPERQVEVIDHVDVLIAGGGPAGVCAAVASTRAGARTFLAERHGFLGGMWAAGMVNPIYGFFARHLQIITGIPQEFIDRLSSIPGGAFVSSSACQRINSIRHI